MMNKRHIDRSLRAVWHPCTQMKMHERFPLVPIARASGVWLYDFEGRRYLDAISSWWVNLFGHANPRINAAVSHQLERLEHVLLAGFTHEPVIELSERLSALTGNRLGHCFYASDGASAVEIALKMSFHHWRNAGRPGKHRFISLANSYHGESLGALSVSDVSLFRDAYGPLLLQGATVPSPDWRLAAKGESAESYAVRCACALEDHFERHHAETAALIVEPLVQCAGGMAMHHPEYLRRARALCDRYGVHLIADEIAVGFGRTGTLFAHEQADIVPDLLCLSKGLSGGYLPLSVVLATDVIYDSFYDDDVARGFLHSHSYTGNPLACAAALATLAIFEEDHVIERNRLTAARLNECAQSIVRHARVRDFRTTGMIWAFDVDANDRDFPRQLFACALARELLLRPLGKTVYLMPPYVIDAGEIDLLVTRVLDVLDAAD